MPAVISATKQETDSPQATKAGQLTPDDLYFQEQADAVHKIYATTFPTASIRVVLKALDQATATPETVHVIKGKMKISVVDASYLGFIDYAKPETDSTTKAAEPKQVKFAADDEDEDDEYSDEITIVAHVPRKLRQGEVSPEKVSPPFHDKPALSRLLRASPFLFEQLKYLYEIRQEKSVAQRHLSIPLKRATKRTFGELTESRDLTKPPSILIGFHWLETGGAENLAFDCVKWARAAGLRVIVLAEKPGIHQNVEKLPQDPDVEFIRADAYLEPSNWLEFLDGIIRTENVRAIHIHHNRHLYDNLLPLKAMFTDLTVIDSTHIVEYLDGGYPRTSGVWNRYIDYHHVISKGLETFFLDKFGVSEKVILGRMLKPARINDDLPAPKLRLEAGQKTLRLIFVGRMVHQKRVPLVVEITKKLNRWSKKNGVNLHVDMVGTGAYLEVVKWLVKSAKLSDVITLHPANTDVPKLLSKADVMLLPSSNEGLALVCYEAIENGVIPISTDVGSQNELVPESLLVSRSPIKCVRETVALVKRLFSEPAFLEASKNEALVSYRNLRKDPTAEETLTSLYREIAKGSYKK